MPHWISSVPGGLLELIQYRGTGACHKYARDDVSSDGILDAPKGDGNVACLVLQHLLHPCSSLGLELRGESERRSD
jgi:hypothetical protein